MTILLVTGGREYTDRASVEATLWPLFREADGSMVLVHGAARGADTLADETARLWNRKHPLARVEIVSMPITIEERRQHGNYAGPRRNGRMVRAVWEHADPDKRCVGFRGGSGTADCLMRARNAGFVLVPVVELVMM